jgi:hypothetical protein
VIKSSHALLNASSQKLSLRCEAGIHDDECLLKYTLLFQDFNA